MDRIYRNQAHIQVSRLQVPWCQAIATLYPKVPSGTNVVLFDPTLVKIGPSKLVEVREVGISYGPIEDE